MTSRPLTTLSGLGVAAVFALSSSTSRADVGAVFGRTVPAPVHVPDASTTTLPTTLAPTPTTSPPPDPQVDTAPTPTTTATTTTVLIGPQPTLPPTDATVPPPITPPRDVERCPLWEEDGPIWAGCGHDP